MLLNKKVDKNIRLLEDLLKLSSSAKYFYGKENPLIISSYMSSPISCCDIIV